MTTAHAPLVVVAPDAFKGSLSAEEAAAALAEGVARAFSAGEAGSPIPEVRRVPMADGGEGTLDALLAAWGAGPRQAIAPDAIGRPRTARYGVSADGSLGVLELAEASGLPGVSDVAARPREAHTRGCGVVAVALLEAGVEEIVVCLGGSASTDGGAGFLRELGVRLLDGDGREVPEGGGALANVVRVDGRGLHPRARQVRWRLAVDVANPLVGPNGSAAVYGPQKGATPEDVSVLDAALADWARVIAIDPSTAGLGAAGGVPAGLLGVLGSSVVSISPGARLVAEAAGLPEALAGAHLVLTGEGGLDAQSTQGKVVGTVAALAAETNPLSPPPVVAIVGRVDLSHAQVRHMGLHAAFSIAPGPIVLDDLVAIATDRLRDVAAGVAGLSLRRR